MSSGTQVNMGASRAMLGAITPKVVNQPDGPSNFLSHRQQELDILWRHYRCASYDDRETNWDGSKHVPKIEREYVATAGYTPPGYYDAGQTAPLNTRRPSSPYYLGKVIVDRFTGLLFSERRHPKIRCLEDPKTEAWLLSFAKAVRLWQRMIMGRTYGGSMGSLGLGIKFDRGKPIAEVHDPRWCTPEFTDRTELTVERLEKLYQYPEQVRDQTTGEWIEGWFWYKRVIDEESDTTWAKIPVDDGEEPDWDVARHVTIQHNFGFCPVVWIQNAEVQDSIDGDPDCHGAFDTIEEMDCLIAQANRGIKANCDPTLIITTDQETDGQILKGSDNSIILEKGGSAQYLELNGSGPKAAMEQAGELEQRVLRVTRCVLDDNFAGPARTEEEVKQNYSNMLERADTMREQYGERGIKKLLEMAIRAAKKLAAPEPEEREDAASGGRVIRLVQRSILLPADDEGRAVELGEGETVTLEWPDYYEPSLDRVKAAVDAASAALSASLIDDEHAMQYVSQYFKVDVAALLKKWATEAEAAAAKEAAAAAPAQGEEGEAAPAAAQDTALNGAQIGSVKDLVMSAAAGELPQSTVAKLINLAVPSVSVEAAIDILGPVGTPAFKPASPEDPASAYTQKGGR